MNILAIVGSYRKHQTIDALVDRALEGATAGRTGDVVDKIYLSDRHIEYCRNCPSPSPTASSTTTWPSSCPSWWRPTPSSSARR